MKIIAILPLLLGLSACTVFLGDPDERVAKFKDFELCTELADKTFKYHPEWAWAITDEIKKRELDSSAECQTVYSNRIDRLTRKLKTKPLNFEEALASTSKGAI
ncbi:hypothetical protein swp_1073 [Shewanella piezotolerans WP3]|uniref:Lipoprotein n=1 Tax=Shewanella piezotolerans (strain WP3 / JCM 13877) TaxID=225849 RepID=B8CJB1_SHEPW|nr:hypothetical protein [Shewanella piezotolerans]ACJ27873.1 hypothetical protein swp_1073 [Shewanella piezotolerans WP3]